MKKITATIRVTRRFAKRMLFCLSTITVFALIVGVNTIVNKVNAKQIVINDQNLSLTYETSKKTVQNFLEENEIELGENDSINFPLDYEIFEGMIIKINRAVPVKLYLNGKLQTVYTSSKTIDEFLDEQNIKMLPSDDINCSLDTLIINNLEIIINLYDTEIIEVDEDIPYGTTYELSTLLEKGKTKIKKQGKNGSKHVTYEIRYLNGKQISCDELNEEVIVEPENEIVLQGTKQTVTFDGKTYDVKKTLSMTATGYDNCYICCGKNPGDPGYGITASGVKTRHGIVAVDPSIIPLGTKLYVTGYGEAIAADTGSAIKGYKIDLYFPTHEIASDYGVHKDLKVYVLDD